MGRPAFVHGMITGALLLGGGLFLGGWSNVREDRPGIVRAERVEIVDELGTVRVVLGSSESGGALSVRDRLGRTMLIAGTGPGGGVLVINDAETRQAVARIGSGGEGGECSLAGTDGVTRLRLAGTPAGGSMHAADRAGRTAVSVQVSAAGAGMVETLDAARSAPLVAIGATGDGQGQIRVNGPDGQPRTIITASERREGQIYTFADDRRPLLAFATDARGPVIRLYNVDGDAAVALDHDAESRGRVIVYDRDGIGRAIVAQSPRSRIIPARPEGDAPFESLQRPD